MRKAIYSGSFDPMTYGHLDIIKRSAALFDELVVAVLDNKEKTKLFYVDERVNILKEAVKDIPNVKVDSFSGLLADYCKANDITVNVRGLRNSSDFEYEFTMALYNRDLSDDGVETIYLNTLPEYSYVSSSGVKEVAAFGGDISKYVPEFVEKLIWEKYK